MAISDIPEYVEVQPGDLISAGSWNQVQQLSRNSLRLHQHTRPIGAPPTDSDTTDIAAQIGGNEIANGAIASSHLSAGCVGAANIATGAVTSSALAAQAVGSAAIANNAVNSTKLAFQTIGSGSLSLGPGGSSEVIVQSAAPSTKTTVYFPTLAIVGSTGTGNSDVTAQIAYRQNVGATTNDVYVRVINTGAATAAVIWEVLTFAQ